MKRRSLIAAAAGLPTLLPPMRLQANTGAPVTTDSKPDPMPQPTVGRLERLPRIASRHVDARHVDVWLPEGYDGRTPHAVLYQHDGQMLFDERITWNRQSWRADQALQRLIREGTVPPTILVGVWNNEPLRYAEYFPQKVLEHLHPVPRERIVKDAMRGQPRADAYLRFLVEELKPAIDARYATRTGPEHTAILGSSMGGLISVYALCEHPQVFGAAAGLSTHWVGGRTPSTVIPEAAVAYLREKLPAPEGRRLYQDHGTTELDSLYPPYQPMIDGVVREKGYGPAQYLSRVFEGTGHNERVWADRLHIPMAFLLGGR